MHVLGNDTVTDRVPVEPTKLFNLLLRLLRLLLLLITLNTVYNHVYLLIEPVPSTAGTLS